MGMAKHEIVVADKHLPAWIYLHEKNQTSYIEPHWHSSIEISYTLSVSISDFFIAGQSYKTQPGRILVVNSAELHSIRAIHDPKQDPRALTIIFPYRIIKRYKSDIYAYKFNINTLSEEKWDSHPAYQFTINSVDLEEGARLPAYRALQEKLTAIADLYHSKDHLRKTILLLEILELLLDHFLEKRRIALSDKQDRQQKERITDIKIYIEDNFRAELALEDIANASYLSKEHLARFFKEQMNITVIQYLNYVRAKHAYPLLLEGQMTATQVALDCGFSGLRTMDRALVKNYGLTSREIRKKAINQRP